MERARSGQAGAERGPRDGQVGRAETGSTVSAVKVDAFSAAFTNVGIWDAIGMLNPLFSMTSWVCSHDFLYFRAPLQVSEASSLLSPAHSAARSTRVDARLTAELASGVYSAHLMLKGRFVLHSLSLFSVTYWVRSYNFVFSSQLVDSSILCLRRIRPRVSRGSKRKSEAGTTNGSTDEKRGRHNVSGKA
jgi:hypothetical protein